MVRKAQTKEAPELFINTVTGESGHIIDGKRVVDQPVEIQKKPREGAKAQSQEVAIHEKKSQEPVPLSETEAMLQMIERVIRDPTINIERINAVLDIRKDIQNEAAKRVWFAAMSAAQADMPQIFANKENTQTRSRYASYEAIDKIIRPIYTKHGFSLIFDTEDSPLPDHIRNICDVTKDGYTRRFHNDMPADGKGAKGGDVMTRTHAASSAMQYGQRYLVKGIFNLAITLNPDDDGNAAGKIGLISAEQCNELVELGNAAGIAWPPLRDWLNKRKQKVAHDINVIEDIPASRFDETVEGIRKFQDAAKDREAAMRQAKTRR